MGHTNSKNVADFSSRLSTFSTDLYSKLIALNPNENIIFSPFSIQSCMAMVRLGASGETAQELDTGLGLISNDATQIAKSFHHVLSAYKPCNFLRIANKVYISNGYELREKFSSLIRKKFLSSTEHVNFAENVEAASTINSWVEERTNHLIKDIVSPTALDCNTRLVLVNAIHFEGNWEHPFQKIDNRHESFFLNNVISYKVEMMQLKKCLLYAELPNLDATALELPYKNSDLSMLIILPSSRTGLSELEEKLRCTPLTQITHQLQETYVQVRLPKFKSEFEMELTEAFKQLGMTHLFSSDADFSKMVKSPEHLMVSNIIHKAFISVNESGTEAAAASGAMEICLDSASPTELDPILFYADHSFIYHIINRESMVLFTGKLLKP